MKELEIDGDEGRDGGTKTKMEDGGWKVERSKGIKEEEEKNKNDNNKNNRRRDLPI
ncbi:hypothetical protein TWF679_008271 [Orbilia oligospora]|uniref:Uncharacterized protein n=1 Tax=Orbilia oligospora TaxID=2813651 RepID=A0A8H8V5P1_ORBOL|nr:hypothetical protein TWF679_008271 [Orbilia oligospora]